MSDKPQSSSAAARPSWNKDEWEAKARAKDEENAEYAKSAEAALLAGKAPPRRRLGDDMPKPTKNLEARKDELDLNKNLNKTMLVQTSTTGKGPKGAGFYCEMCNRTFKDSLSYLDHINGRGHLRMLGQTTQVERSTLTQVRAKIAALREATKTAVTAKNFDFQARLKAVKEAESIEKDKRREERKRKRDKKREEEELQRMGIFRGKVDQDQQEGNGKSTGKDAKKRRKLENREDREVEAAIKEREDMASMMGFGGFGGAKKR
ncbi:hypothetical protein I302_104058 [Kwoniella bestiolae CBS 10118]|uniref:C2H2-type domain-containing protein n=1 Tax=Kwoniella bestiolae CBS 10118 TaxID=1296100 RepID=A0A1B9GA74_9TREE|nr:hypothetical protein I302_02763 [Kwoniella bestiolae CBS 10118]OCF27913.1 hypothetical protein I302_02763 [Kwoniella bestiolae CBS 10118]